MKKLSCFALVLALVLAAGSAFAMTTSNAEKLAPYDTTADYDMFTISADYASFDLASGAYKGVEKYNWATNKSIKSPDIVGLAFYLESNDFWSHTAFKLGAYDETTTPTKANLRLLSRFWSPDWYSVLLRTTKYADGQGDGQSIQVPLKVFISDDVAKSYWIALSGDATNQLVCTYPCCGVNFNIDCCAPGEYGDITSHTLKIWFNDADRVAVYCCPGVPFTLVEAISGDNKIKSADRMSVPFTIARLNDKQNMVRVRVDTNFRDENQVLPQVLPAGNAGEFSWFRILDKGMYSESDLCSGVTETFWPWKDEFVCAPDANKYYWNNGKPTSHDYKDFRGSASFWATKDHIELADVRLGETLNLGVWYGGANINSWAEKNFTNNLCICEAESNCSLYNEKLLPRINIQNLGTVRLDVAKCHEDPADYGICAADCGLCDTLSYDLEASRDVDARDGYRDGLYKFNLTAGLMNAATRTAYSGIFRELPTTVTGSNLIDASDANDELYALTQKSFVTAAYRWGDFFHVKDSELDDDIITIHCPCYIYPSFTKTVQPAANSDFSFEMSDGGSTKINGRWNTSYYTGKLTSNAGNLCSPECSFLYVYYPCGCEATVVVTTLEKNLTSLIGKTFVNTVVSFDYATMLAKGDLKLEGARNVTNEAADTEDSRFDGIVAAAKTAEGSNLLWYNVFKVSEWDIAKNVAKTTTLEGILPVQLRFELDYDKISADIDLNTAGWRDQVWEKFTLKTRNLDGTVNDIMSDVVDGKAALDKQTFVTVLANDELKTTGHVAWTKLHVFLTVFVVDGPSPDGKAFHYLKIDETGNYVLFVFDGKHDDVYEDMLYVAKPSSSACAINASDMTVLVGETKTYTVTLTGDCACDTVSWDNVSTDVVEVVISGDAKVLEITGLKTGSVTNRVFLECDNSLSKDVTITVVTPTLTPTPTAASGGSSSGGCNAGAFAPLALLLIAPVVLLLKK